MGPAAQGGLLLLDLAADLDLLLGQREQRLDVVGRQALDPEQVPVRVDGARRGHAEAMAIGTRARSGKRPPPLDPPRSADDERPVPRARGRTRSRTRVPRGAAASPSRLIGPDCPHPAALWQRRTRTPGRAPFSLTRTGRRWILATASTATIDPRKILPEAPARAASLEPMHLLTGRIRMTVGLREFASKALEAKRIRFADLRRLQRDVLPCRITNRVEAEVLLALDGTVDR